MNNIKIIKQIDEINKYNYSVNYGYYDNNGLFIYHNINSPAILKYLNNRLSWYSFYYHGKLHNESGPASVMLDETNIYGYYYYNNYDMNKLITNIADYLKINDNISIDDNILLFKLSNGFKNYDYLNQDDYYKIFNLALIELSHQKNNK